jgi:hypothetical protein
LEAFYNPLQNKIAKKNYGQSITHKDENFAKKNM